MAIYIRYIYMNVVLAMMLLFVLTSLVRLDLSRATVFVWQWFTPYFYR